MQDTKRYISCINVQSVNMFVRYNAMDLNPRGDKAIWPIDNLNLESHMP